MAKATTDEQTQLRRRARRRLIGAIALAIVIAVVLPWVLEGEPQQPEQDVSIQIPSLDSTPFEPKGVPAAPDTATKPDTDAAPAAPALPPAAAVDEPRKAAD